MSETKKNDPDAWLMVEYFRKINSKYGCTLCTKTHLPKDCKYLKERLESKEKPEKFSYSKMYSAYEQDEEENYGH